MAENDSSQIFVSGTAVVSITYDIKTFAELPNTTDEELDGYVNLGLTSEDGEELETSKDTEQINAHQLANARTIATSGTFTLSLSALESNAVAKALYFGAQASGGVTVIDPSKALYVTVVYDTLDVEEGFEKKLRYSFVAMVAANGSITYAKTGAAMYPLQFTAQGNVKLTEKTGTSTLSKIVKVD